MFLIRHGQTDYNRQKMYCGRSDPGLNKDGRGQAEMARLRLDKEGIRDVYCSPAKRAQETARIMFPRGRIICYDPLREIDFGLWEGKTYEQILCEYGDVYRRWLDNPYACDIPAGEPLSAFRQRVLAGFSHVLKGLGGKRNLAVVTHFGPIRIILGELRGEGDPGFWKIKVEPCGIYEIDAKVVNMRWEI